MMMIMQKLFPDLLKLTGRVKHLEVDEVLFNIGDPVESMYLVQKGSMILRRQTAAGTNLILQTTRAASILAEASFYSSCYHCDSIAQLPTQVHAFSKAEFRRQLTQSQQLSEAWAKSLAMSMQEARTRAEIRTLRTVAERLEAWQSMGHIIPEKGQWQDVAVEIGVTREALYRELARSRKLRNT